MTADPEATKALHAASRHASAAELLARTALPPAAARPVLAALAGVQDALAVALNAEASA